VVCGQGGSDEEERVPQRTVGVVRARDRCDGCREPFPTFALGEVTLVFDLRLLPKFELSSSVIRSYI